MSYLDFIDYNDPKEDYEDYHYRNKFTDEELAAMDNDDDEPEREQTDIA